MELYEITEYEEILSKRNYKEDVMLSVWCVTYNHGKYIKEALEGFVSQKTNFRYKVVIFDDASTDNSQEIIKEYAKMYPELFHVFLLKKNIHAHPQRRIAVNNLRKRVLTGKYVAFCEGDDFWTDSGKIQLQVEYMENNPSCILTVHDGICLDCVKNERRRMIGEDEERDLSAGEIIGKKKGLIPTASMVIRKEYAILEDFFGECTSSDWTMQIKAFLSGEVHYFGKCMCCYRYMHKDSWTSEIRISKEKMFLQCVEIDSFLSRLDEYSKYRYNKYIIEMKQQYVNIALNNFSEDMIEYIKNIAVKKDGIKRQRYASDLLEQVRRRTDRMYFPQEIKEELLNYKNIWVMGTGHYSKIISSQLKNNGIQIKGYLVSSGQSKDGMNGEVYYASEITEAKNEIFVLIAIDPIIYGEIQEELEKNEIYNYGCTLLI